MLPTSGQIAASNINNEFSRGSTTQFSMYDARNGNYGAINNASGFRPTANGQSGYAWSHWWGYNHTCLTPIVYTMLYEPYVGINVRYYVYDAYGNNIINEFWYYSNTSGYQSLASDTGVTIRTQNSVQILWNPDGWGSGNIYKQVYSFPDGVYIYNLYEDAYIQRLFTFTINPAYTAKNVRYYVNASPDPLPF